MVVPDLVNLSEDEPYGVKGANIIVKYSKLQDKQNISKEQDSKLLKIRRTSNVSTSSLSSDQFDTAEILGNFQMSKKTVIFIIGNNKFELKIICSKHLSDP